MHQPGHYLFGKRCLNTKEYKGEEIRCREGYLHGRYHGIGKQEGDFQVWVCWYDDEVKEEV